MTSDVFAAIDAGTSGIKCIAMGLDAHDPFVVSIVGHAAVEVRRPGPGLAEIDPPAILAAAHNLLRELFRQAHAAGKAVRSIGLTGQIGGLICIDRAGAPLGPCLTWEDQRCAMEAVEFAKTFGRSNPKPLGVALPPGVCWPAPKLLWLKRHHPKVLAKTRKVMQLKDYLFFHLTGKAWSEAVTMMGLANVRGTVSEEVFGWCLIHPNRMPELHPATSTAQMPQSVADQLIAAPLSVLPEIGIGTADMKAGFWGCDLHPGQGVLLAGTAEIIGRIAPRSPAGSAPAGLVRLPYDDETDIIYGSTTNGAASLNWLQQAAGPFDVGELAREAETIPPGSEGLLFIPHLAGARAPLWDAQATGAFLGLRSSHRRVHLFRAVLEGCAWSKRHVLEAGGHGSADGVKEITIAGGNARLDLWNRIRASVLNRPLSVLPCGEASALGALFLAADNLHPELRREYTARPRHDRQVTPDPAWVGPYEAGYRRFLAASEEYLRSPSFREGAIS